MSDENVTPVAAASSANLPIKKAAEFRFVYSNVFQYRVTISDVSVIFSLVADTGEVPSNYEQTQQVGVIMALGQAKNLAEYLTMIVSRYEREIGPILGVGNAPPDESELDFIFGILKGIGTHR
jgi:hypothetical protein